jgi:hypothetical protein
VCTASATDCYSVRHGSDNIHIGCLCRRSLIFLQPSLSIYLSLLIAPVLTQLASIISAFQGQVQNAFLFQLLTVAIAAAIVRRRRRIAFTGQVLQHVLPFIASLCARCKTSITLITIVVHFTWYVQACASMCPFRWHCSRGTEATLCIGSRSGA